MEVNEIWYCKIRHNMIESVQTRENMTEPDTVERGRTQQNSKELVKKGQNHQPWFCWSDLMFELKPDGFYATGASDVIRCRQVLSGVVRYWCIMRGCSWLVCVWHIRTKSFPEVISEKRFWHVMLSDHRRAAWPHHNNTTTHTHTHRCTQTHCWYRFLERKKGNNSGK